MNNKPFNAIVYKIKCKLPEMKCCYIGSTINIQRRSYEHKTASRSPRKKSYNLPLYQAVRNSPNEWNDWYIQILAEVRVCSYKELRAIERVYIENTENIFNHVIPNRTKEEYYENNKEKIRERKRRYHYKNRTEILKSRKKNYQENKEKIKAQVLQHYRANRNKILEVKRSEKREWFYGAITSRGSNIYKHLKTKLHYHCMKQFTKDLLQARASILPHLCHAD